MDCSGFALAQSKESYFRSYHDRLDGKMDFTVAIPTLNGALRIPKVLDQLQLQMGVSDISWEVLVVDNNSTDLTPNIIEKYQADWPREFSLRYWLEPKQGLTHARQSAVEQANGKYIGFLDDDNIPSHNWVSTAYHFGQNNPSIGAFAGKIHAKLDQPAPEYFEQVENYLAIRQYGDESKLFNPQTLQLPAGAGLVVRRVAWLDCVPSSLEWSHRGGDDYLISLYLYKQGWQIGYAPKLEIWHHIPANRLTKDYLTNLAYLYGLKNCDMLVVITSTQKTNWTLLKAFLGGSKRLALHLIKCRFKVFTDVGFACETAFHWGNLLSPWFYLCRSLHKNH
jgi:glycosyltransferase involved in cell wall biosynthesis